MKDIISGKAFVLGNDIDTDQIIPAKYLVYSLEKADEQKKYGEKALSGVPLENSGLPNGNIPFVEQGNEKSQFTVIVAGKNFGCGSSREHAPAALQIAGVEAVIAPSYARIFYRNAIDGGFLLPLESHESITNNFETGDSVTVSLKEHFILNERTGHDFSIRGLGEVEEIIDAGGIFAFARKAGMLEGVKK